MTADLKQKPYYVYMLACSDGSIYTGIAIDVEKRFIEHKTGLGARYTRARSVVKILYTELCLTRSEGLRREAEIKSWSRDKKLAFIKASQ